MTFEDFWKMYPRKVGKKKARTLFDKISPALHKQIEEAIENYKLTEQWQKENGKFIPHPYTFLYQERWEDEIPVIRNNFIRL